MDRTQDGGWVTDGRHEADGPEVGNLDKLTGIFSAEELPETLTELREEMRKELTVLQTAAADELDAVRTAAHSLKNSAGLFAATRLLESARHLEAAMRENRLGERDGLVATIAAELSRLETLIAAELDRLAGDAPVR